MQTNSRKLMEAALLKMMFSSAGKDKEQVVAERWNTLFAEAAQQIRKVGYVVHSRLTPQSTSLEMPLNVERKLSIILDFDEQQAPFIYLRLHPFLSLNYDDEWRNLFHTRKFLYDFSIYKSQYYSHTLEGTDRQMIRTIVQTAVTIMRATKKMTHNLSN